MPGSLVFKMCTVNAQEHVKRLQTAKDRADNIHICLLGSIIVMTWAQGSDGHHEVASFVFPVMLIMANKTLRFMVLVHAD